MMGTTTTAISMKSRKKAQNEDHCHDYCETASKNPPGSEFRNSRTSSSPPKARNAAVSICCAEQDDEKPAMWSWLSLSSLRAKCFSMF